MRNGETPLFRCRQRKKYFSAAKKAKLYILNDTLIKEEIKNA